MSEIIGWFILAVLALGSLVILVGLVTILLLLIQTLRDI